LKVVESSIVCERKDGIRDGVIWKEWETTRHIIGPKNLLHWLTSRNIPTRQCPWGGIRSEPM